jgi:hypothetical protein
MTNIGASNRAGEHALAYEEGRRAGLATAALLIGVVSFISMLGVEKALVAITLGALTIKGPAAGRRARRMGTAAIVLGGLFIATVGVVLALFWDKVGEFLRLLQHLS